MKAYKNKKHILVTVLAATVLMAGGTLAYAVFYSDLKNTTANDIERQQKQLAAIAAGEIERSFYDLQKRIETMALAPDIRDAQRSESCNQQLQRLVEVNSQELNNLGRVSKDGTFVCAVNRTIIGEPVSKYGDYFDKIAKDPQHKPVLSRLILPSGSPSAVVALHVPVFGSNGQFNGTIGGAIYFDELQKRILADTTLSPGSFIAMYDDNMDVLSHPDPLTRGKSLNTQEVKQLHEPFAAIEQVIRYSSQGSAEGVIDYSLHGAPYHAAYKSAAVLGRHWTVAVAVPKNDIAAFVGRPLAQYLFIGVGVLLVAAGTTATFALTRPTAHKKAQQV